MLKAKLDRIRKNKKGFSLVELIIVIAIMVALIAVMAPNFVKYVQKSRDTALKTAAEDFLSAVKVAYGDPDSDYTLPTGETTYTITIEVDGGKIKIDSTTLANQDIKVNGSTVKALAALKDAAGVDDQKAMGKTNDIYTITIAAGPKFTMTGSTKTA